MELSFVIPDLIVSKIDLDDVKLAKFKFYTFRHVKPVRFTFKAPQQLEIVGSFALQTMLNPSRVIDVAMFMPQVRISYCTRALSLSAPFILITALVGYVWRERLFRFPVS